MLAILYIISILASLRTPIHDRRGEFKKSLQSLAIAVISATLYIIPVIYKMCKDSSLNFWPIFGLFSLIFLDIALLTDDRTHLLSLTVTAFLASTVICFLHSAINFSDYLISCNENHVHTEIVPIITTVDGTDLGKSIYGDGFVIGLIYKFTPNMTIYQYNFQDEEGNIVTEEIPAGRTEITFIEDDVSPYIEITATSHCMGYRIESKRHVFYGIRNTYHLFIPEGSIVNITPTS